MNILGFDTSTQLLSAALQSGDSFFHVEAEGQKHSELIMDMTDFLLKTAGIRAFDLDFVACMKGPGSFTGLRIGFAAAKGLVLSLGKPMTSIPTLDCMALPFSFWPGIVLPVIDAKKKAWFTALYRKGENISGYLDAQACRIASILIEQAPGSPILISGSDGERACSELSPFIPQSLLFTAPPRAGRARDLIELAKSRIMFDNEGYNSGPLYLRKSDAELNG